MDSNNKLYSVTFLFVVKVFILMDFSICVYNLRDKIQISYSDLKYVLNVCITRRKLREMIESQSHQEQTVFVLKRLKWTGAETVCRKQFPNNLGPNIREMCSYNEVSRCHPFSITMSMDVIQHSSHKLSQYLCCLDKIKSAKLLVYLIITE